MSSTDKGKISVFHSILTYLPQLTPLLLLIAIGLLVYHIINSSAVSSSPQEQETLEPSIDELEKKLEDLLIQNHLDEKKENLHQQLKSSKSNIIASYLQLSHKDLRGYHLFQLILSLIKNQTEDNKIIKIMHRYLPSCATSHLYAMLKAYKKFLNLSQKDNCQKKLLNDLNKNHLRSTLIYLEHKLNQIINKIPLTPPALQQPLVNQAMIYGLIFASFSQFYSTQSTEKILRLAATITPELFRFWHLPPQKKNLKKAKQTCLALTSKKEGISNHIV